MAQCRYCKKSGFLLSVKENGICYDCNNKIMFDFQQKWRIITESLDICDKSKNFETIISRMDLALQLTNELLQYDEYNIFKTKFSDALNEFASKKQNLIFAQLKSHYEVTIEKMAAMRTVNAKVNQITKFKFELIKYFPLLTNYQIDLQEVVKKIDKKIIKMKYHDLIDEAKIFEFKGNKKRALDKYYDALYLIRTDNIDDTEQSIWINETEKKIIEMGGEIRITENLN